ncbi:ribonuclease Z [Methylocystis hirsuta]|uniref:Ribonuclease Z n=1 Tax=Methylocystis hirsuta TaxID=369798 RepID=A0A3M9XMQ5_9HYPH|nr:MBL fold metallo-hydrolase [Methylocystis hirsuta]RNJ48160.1 ribonuclease Z [Methylocystis hirsuta]
MPRHFDPTLVNDPFDDPGLYVDLVFERRALLFDLGDIARLSPRKILRISDVFVTHRHMDHFAGFDQLLRRVLGREKMLGLYGPAGTIDAVEHKLKAHTWNLIDEYGGNLVCSVTEIDEAGRQTSAKFCGRTRFERSNVETQQADDGLLHKEPGFQVRATTLDHGVPVLALALEERAQIDVWRNKVDAMGLAVGPWLRRFKEAILRGVDDDVLVDIGWAVGQLGRPTALPLGLLKREIMQITSGRKIVYVVDCSFSDANREKIIRLARDADILFIEATFLDADAAIAQQRHHLTACQAGTLARLAGAKRFVTFHYSPRYKGQGQRPILEAQKAFLNG